MSVGIFLRCDGCDTVFVAADGARSWIGPRRPPAHELRRAAVSLGWRAQRTYVPTSDEGRGAKDYCPVCVHKHLAQRAMDALAEPTK